MRARSVVAPSLSTSQGLLPHSLALMEAGSMVSNLASPFLAFDPPFRSPSLWLGEYLCFRLLPYFGQHTRSFSCVQRIHTGTSHSQQAKSSPSPADRGSDTVPSPYRHQKPNQHEGRVKHGDHSEERKG